MGARAVIDPIINGYGEEIGIQDESRVGVRDDESATNVVSDDATVDVLSLF
jgi:hypothetical protein